MTDVKINNIRVICCDIDATLTWMQGMISEANRKAIEDLMDKGILFGLGSGRSYADLSTYPEKWGMRRPFDFYVGLNGASLYDEAVGKDEVFFQIEREYTKMLVEEIDRLDMDSHVYINGITYFSRNGENFKRASQNRMRDIRVVEDLSEMYQDRTSKVLINVKDEQMPEVRKHFAPLLQQMEGEVKLLRTSPGSMEFVPAKANKFYALKKYCDRHGIDMKDVAAFGDTSNDNEMIEGAGLGVCMINGTDDTKALADMISEYPAKDDGFARFVYQHIL